MVSSFISPKLLKLFFTVNTLAPNATIVNCRSRASPFGLLGSAVQVVQDRRSFLENDLAVQIVAPWVVIVLRDEFKLRLALFLPCGSV